MGYSLFQYRRNNMYYNEGKKAELDFCKLMEKWGGGILIDDFNEQMKDIDVKLKKCGRTVSVKDQHSADKYQCFLFEHRQIRTSDLNSMNGNVISCEADIYAIATKTEWFIFDAPKLKALLMSGVYPDVYTNTRTEQMNRKKKGNNCFDRTISWRVTFKQLEESDSFLYRCKRI